MEKLIYFFTGAQSVALALFLMKLLQPQVTLLQVVMPTLILVSVLLCLFIYSYAGNLVSTFGAQKPKPHD